MAAKKQSKSDKKPAQYAQKNHSLDVFKSSRLIVFAQASFYTLVMIAVIAGGAYWLDHYLGTFPKIFIGGLVIAYPLTQVLIFKKIKKFSREKLEPKKNQK